MLVTLFLRRWLLTLQCSRRWFISSG